MNYSMPPVADCSEPERIPSAATFYRLPIVHTDSAPHPVVSVPPSSIQHRIHENTPVDLDFQPQQSFYHFQHSPEALYDEDTCLSNFSEEEFTLSEPLESVKAGFYREMSDSLPTNKDYEAIGITHPAFIPNTTGTMFSNTPQSCRRGFASREETSFTVFEPNLNPLVYPVNEQSYSIEHTNLVQLPGSDPDTTCLPVQPSSVVSLAHTHSSGDVFLQPSVHSTTTHPNYSAMPFTQDPQYPPLPVLAGPVPVTYNQPYGSNYCDHRMIPEPPTQCIQHHSNGNLPGQYTPFTFEEPPTSFNSTVHFSQQESSFGPFHTNLNQVQSQGNGELLPFCVGPSIDDSHTITAVQTHFHLSEPPATIFIEKSHPPTVWTSGQRIPQQHSLMNEEYLPTGAPVFDQTEVGSSHTSRTFQWVDQNHTSVSHNAITEVFPIHAQSNYWPAATHYSEQHLCAPKSFNTANYALHAATNSDRTQPCHHFPSTEPVHKTGQQFVAPQPAPTNSSVDAYVSYPSAHIPTSAGEHTTDISCQQCGHVFNRLSHLEIHLRTHTNEYPHDCVLCDRRFIQPSNLRRHLLSHKTWPPLPSATRKYHGVPPISTPQMSGSIAIRKRISNGVKRWICRFCGQQQTTYRSLRRHMVGHKDNRVYACIFHECLATFNFPHDLLNHIIDTHQITFDRSTGCPTCDRTFSDVKQFVRHWLPRHRGLPPRCGSGELLHTSTSRKRSSKNNASTLSNRIRLVALKRFGNDRSVGAFRCPICPRRCHRLSRLRYHLTSAHRQLLASATEDSSNILLEGKLRKTATVPAQSISVDPQASSTELPSKTMLFLLHVESGHSRIANKSRILTCHYCGKNFKRPHWFTDHQIMCQQRIKEKERRLRLKAHLRAGFKDESGVLPSAELSSATSPAHSSVASTQHTSVTSESGSRRSSRLRNWQQTWTPKPTRRRRTTAPRPGTGMTSGADPT